MRHEKQLAATGLFEAKVPRYTSYPAANHFSADFGEGEYRDWLARVPEGAEISLYLHVPFCRRLCWFCACRTQGTSAEAPLRAYLATLKTEIAMLRRALPPRIRLSRLHWGGGTPTILSTDMIQELAGALRDSFPLGPRSEFSVEIDPNEIDAARLDALVGAGMNRASIGVQDFDPDIQKVIGREQSFEITRDVITEIRARGVNSINADILYGLPHQDSRRITASVRSLIELAPDRVALYGYAHVPWMARRQAMIPAEALPDPRARLGLYDVARRLFLWAGYSEIGIDHFAKSTDGLAIAAQSGQLRRNFQGYTDDQAEVLVGLGASAISRMPQGYAQNAPATAMYQGRIRDGHFATARGHVMSRDDRMRAMLIEALMCNFEADIAEITAAFGEDAAGLVDEVAQVAAGFGDLVTFDGEILAITADGRPATRMIARAFDAYNLSRQGHSHAI